MDFVVYSLFLFMIICILFLYYCYKKNKKLLLEQKLKEEEKFKNYIFKITHEVKNPLAVCKGYFSMMDLKNSEKTEKYLEIIQGEIERTLTLLEDYLKLGHIELSLDVMDINLLVEDVVSSFFPLLQDQQIQYQVSCYQDELFVLGDYEKLKQVLLNLLKNSVEAKRKNETLELNLKVSRKKNQVEIILEDNGVGMKKETFSKIGTEFFTTKLGGTGLGVSVSNEIVVKHGGNMHYVSEEGKGTMVTILIPNYDFT